MLLSSCFFIICSSIEEAGSEEEEEDEDGDVEGDLDLHAGMDATGVETPLVDGISSVASGLSTPGGIVDMRKGIRYTLFDFVITIMDQMTLMLALLL